MPDQSLILGIETSCDETAAAVVRAGRDVLSNIIASQHDLHAEYRGVVPEIASRAHAERILPVVRSALAHANVSLGDIGAVAVGHRPGLIGSLLVGVAAAKALAWSLGVPLVGVDHVQAHLYASCLDADLAAFPAIGLVVSGGHTAIYSCDSPTNTRRLGSTIDDAVGEAYDKAAAILGLAFPGGPSLDRLAATGGGNDRAVEFPISRLGPDSLDLSFSGLKTAMLYAVRGVPTDPRRPDRPVPPAPPPLTDSRRADLAASFQRAAVGAIILKLTRAIERFPDARTLLVGGGVSANSRLRTQLVSLGQHLGLQVRVPSMDYCLDNAAMIAGLAHHILAARQGRGDDLSLAAEPSSAV